jgi:hypothetical protein
MKPRNPWTPPAEWQDYFILLLNNYKDGAWTYWRVTAKVKRMIATGKEPPKLSNDPIQRLTVVRRVQTYIMDDKRRAKASLRMKAVHAECRTQGRHYWTNKPTKVYRK